MKVSCCLKASKKEKADSEALLHLFVRREKQGSKEMLMDCLACFSFHLKAMITQ